MNVPKTSKNEWKNDICTKEIVNNRNQTNWASEKNKTKIWHSRIYISNSEQFNNGLQCFGLQSPITNIGNIDREDKKVANLVKL